MQSGRRARALAALDHFSARACRYCAETGNVLQRPGSRQHVPNVEWARYWPARYCEDNHATMVPPELFGGNASVPQEVLDSLEARDAAVAAKAIPGYLYMGCIEATGSYRKLKFLVFAQGI